ncbi:hypothetical protein [Raoultella terrigena]|uniref:hypothetical protein n=1 Tax=Raoultella terrigena TaxID=577 RepID=UPI001F24E505|nr:hypothetical protein [Raoultella terrigena]
MYQINVSILVSSGLFYPYVCIIICKDANEIHGERASYQPWFGRGLIQITLRANYEKYGEYIGEDVTSGDSARDKLTRLPHSVLSAFWYYDASRQLGGLAKNDDFNKVTAVINGGFNGYNDRLSIFNSAVKSLGGGHLNKQCTNGAFSFENSSIYQVKYIHWLGGSGTILLVIEVEQTKMLMRLLKAIKGQRNCWPPHLFQQVRRIRKSMVLNM